MTKKTIGLIAGNGKFPFLFAHQAKSQNYHIVTAGIKGDTSFFLRYFVGQYQEFGVGEFSKICEYFKSAGIEKVLMVGQVNQDNLFKEGVQYDEEAQRLWAALEDRKADTIFSAVSDVLAKYGMEVADSTFLLKEFLAPKGTLTHQAPTVSQIEDIQFGRDLAKQMGGIDVGQTVVVKEKAIVAIEAMEGTDATILRGGKIAQRGAVVVKMSKPNQDFRFDVPVIGPRTIRKMIKSNCSCLAIESGKTIIIDYAKTLCLANKASITLVSV